MPTSIVVDKTYLINTFEKISTTLRTMNLLLLKNSLKLNQTVEMCDIMQKISIMTHNVVSHWDKRRAPVASISSRNSSIRRLVIFYLRKHLFGLCEEDIVVTLYQNGCFSRRLSYSSFLKKKHYYIENGFEWKVESRTNYLGDALLEGIPEEIESGTEEIESGI